MEVVTIKFHETVYLTKLMKKIETKILKGDYGHTFQCDVCYEMERRKYQDEEFYFEDLFSGKLKPIKYKLVMQIDKKAFDKWLVCTNPR